jgi:hypothetical protein
LCKCEPIIRKKSGFVNRQGAGIEGEKVRNWLENGSQVGAHPLFLNKKKRDLLPIPG